MRHIREIIVSKKGIFENLIDIFINSNVFFVLVALRREAIVTEITILKIEEIIPKHRTAS